MQLPRSLIAPVANPVLEQALRQKLARRGETTGRFGELEPLGVQLGLIQNTLKPAFEAPQIVVFAADHGLAIDGAAVSARHSSDELVQMLLALQLPLGVFARIQGMQLSVVDGGLAETLAPHPTLLVRKIAHGTRSSRAGPAMSPEQVDGAIRAGMDIGESLPGNAVACAGIGVGSHETAALVLARLGGAQLPELLGAPGTAKQPLPQLLDVLQSVQTRHKEATGPLAVLGAFGGFEISMMAGLMLTAASRRHLIVIDGIPACAALMVASHLAPSVTDYCVHCRSHTHPGLDTALGLFNTTALLELGIDSIDGTGATLAWPLMRSAAALLTDVAEPEAPGARVTNTLPPLH